MATNDDARKLAPVRWGVLGASKFALNISLPGMKKGALTELRALASRDLAKSKAGAQTLGIAGLRQPKAAGRSQIEAIYNPPPNHLHVEWTARAARAGARAVRSRSR
jgi:predicted dehydrogenase